jgi:hypothetical protein
VASEIHELRDELLDQPARRPLPLLPGRRHLLLLAVIAALGAYTYSLLFGHNSLLKLLALKEEQSRLEQRISTLKSENAELQRLLYELQLIRGDGL